MVARIVGSWRHDHQDLEGGFLTLFALHASSRIGKGETKLRLFYIVQFGPVTNTRKKLLDP